MYFLYSFSLCTALTCVFKKTTSVKIPYLEPPRNHSDFVLHPILSQQQSSQDEVAKANSCAKTC